MQPSTAPLSKRADFTVCHFRAVGARQQNARRARRRHDFEWRRIMDIVCSLLKLEIIHPARRLERPITAPPPRKVSRADVARVFTRGAQTHAQTHAQRTCARAAHLAAPRRAARAYYYNGAPLLSGALEPLGRRIFRAGRVQAPPGGSLVERTLFAAAAVEQSRAGDANVPRRRRRRRRRRLLSGQGRACRRVCRRLAADWRRRRETLSLSQMNDEIHLFREQLPAPHLVVQIKDCRWGEKSWRL